MKIPYGKGWLTFPDDLNAELLAPKALNKNIKTPEEEEAIVKAAMSAPIDSPPLHKLARGISNALIIISDHTRPVPSKRILPFILDEIRTASPRADITLLAATGCHRGTTADELVEKLGSEIVKNERIVVHDCDASPTVNLGALPSGSDYIVNSLAAQAELLVAEGFIEPHFFAGYSGGRKSVLPGICNRATVLGNHRASFIGSGFARAGILDNNPVNRDMEAAVPMIGLKYIINVIINTEKRIVAAFAGDPIPAHRAGCAWLAPRVSVKASKPGQIVVAGNGGAPLDQNIYQAVKGMSAAEACAAEGGVIIMCAECADGNGSDHFYRALRDCQSPRALLKDIETRQAGQTAPDQWEYQVLARILDKHRVIMVTNPQVKQDVIEMKMEYAADLEEALNLARADKGANAYIIVIPDGVSVIAGVFNV